MKILICGVDGYIGYPLCANLLKEGHTIIGIDSLYKRFMVSESGLDSIIPIADIEDRVKTLKGFGNYTFKQFDISEGYSELKELYGQFKPDIILNLAQQPSAPYSMKDIGNATFTIKNNVIGLLNLFWCMREYTPKSHIITLGTMGEYGFPNVPIPEGFFEVKYRGMKDVLPFPRQPGSIYHTSKVMSSDLAWMLCKVWELRITEINQGVVYGTETGTAVKTRFDVDGCFGTMINRAVACAVMGEPIRCYGSGEQKRGYIALEDSIKCLTLAAKKPPNDNNSIHGYRVLNQMDESYSCNEIAEIVQSIGIEKFSLNPTIEWITNPRIEPEIHYYNPDHSKLKKMGWSPSKDVNKTVEKMFDDLIPFKDVMLKSKNKIMPEIKWRPDSIAVKD